MALATEDRRFAIGIGVAAAVLAVYAVAVRGPLRSATARTERDVRAIQPKVDLYFRNPKATHFDRVQRELAERTEGLEQRLAALVAAVEFDPGQLDPSGGAAPTTDLRDLYFRLSSDLHDRVKAKAEKAPHIARIPTVFDPQGKIQTPDDPAAVPRLHHQLVMAYLVLDAAIDHRVDVAELRAIEPRLAAASSTSYLDELAVAVAAQGSLDAIAAWLHALSQPPSGAKGSKFLSIASLDVAADPEGDQVAYAVTFVSVRVNPKVNLAAAPAKKPEAGARRRPPRRAPLY